MSPSPSSRTSDGSTVKRISGVKPKWCTEANLQDTTYFKYYAECSTGQIIAELADDADQDFVIDQLMTEVEEKGNFDPWLAGDGWLFQDTANSIQEAREKNPGSVVKTSPNSPMFEYDQMDLIVDAIEERSGAKCSIDYEYDLNSEVTYRCNKGKKDLYTMASVYTRQRSVFIDEMLEKFAFIFKGADREAYSVRTKYWYIHDVPKADANWYAKKLDGEVIDLTNLD